MRNILITGATGTIGTQVVAQLKAAGADFSILSSKASESQGIAARKGSFEDVASLKAAFAGVDTLFVLLPLVPHKVQLARNVAQAAKAAGVQHIVRSSGAGADAKAGFSLPRLQGEIDDIFTATGIPSTFLRNAGFMQNYATFFPQMVKDGTFYAATEDAKQSLVDVRDIAAVAVKILLDPTAHAGKAYTLTGGESLTDTERVALLSQALGRTVSYRAIPAQAAVATMRDEWKMPAESVDWMDSLNRLVSAGYAAGISPDVQTLLGRAPIGFAQFATDYAAIWK
jgi:uncharacterized protein YbjT (DUF2867 family)